MANKSDTPQEQPEITLLHSIDELDHLQCRLAFIMDGITQSSDWIDVKAAEGLYFTIQSIWVDLAAVRDSIDQARGLVRG